MLQNGVDTVGSIKPLPLLLVAFINSDNSSALLRHLRLGTFDLFTIWGDEGATLLHHCALSGGFHCVRALLEEGAVIDITDSDGQTPLFWSLKGAALDVAALLISWGADARHRNAQGWSVWHAAAESHSSAALKFLQDATSKDPGFLSCHATSGASCTSAVMVAAASGSQVSETDALEKVQILIAMGADEWAKDGLQNSTLLHFAAASGAEAVVQSLLARGHDPSAKDNDGRAPIHHCFARNAVQGVFQALHNAQPCEFHKTDDSGIATFLNDIATNDDGDLFEAQIERVAEVLASTEPIHEQVICAHLLRWMEDNIVGLSDTICAVHLPQLLSVVCSHLRCDEASLGLSLLRLVAHESLDSDLGHSCVRILAEVLPANQLQAFRYDGQQLLSVMLKKRWYDVATVLMKRGADTTSRDDISAGAESAQEIVVREGCPPHVTDMILRAPRLSRERNPVTGADLLAHCAQWGSPEHLKIILDAGFDPNARNVVKPAILWTCSTGHFELRARNFEILLAAGADLELAFRKWNIAQAAVAGGNLSILKSHAAATNKYGWDMADWYDIPDTSRIDEPNRSLRGYLTHLAALHGRADILKYLLDHTELLSVKDRSIDRQQFSVLDCAVISGDQETITAALDRGPSLKADKFGWTPLHIAAHFGRSTGIDLLIKHGLSPHAQTRRGYHAAMIARRRGFARIASRLEYEQGSRATVEISHLTEASVMEQHRRQRALGRAIKLGDISLCRSLLNSGARADWGWASCNDCDPMVQAAVARGPNTERLILLLLDRGGLPTRTSCARFHHTTVIQECAAAGYDVALSLIIEKYPGLLFVEYDIPLLHLAILNGRLKCLRLILKKREEAWRKFVHAECRLPEIAPLEQESPGIGETLRSMSQQKTALRIIGPWEMLDAGAKFSARPGFMVTETTVAHTFATYGHCSLPLQCAAWCRSFEAIHLLISHGADTTLHEKYTGSTISSTAMATGWSLNLVRASKRWGLLSFNRDFLRSETPIRSIADSGFVEASRKLDRLLDTGLITPIVDLVNCSDYSKLLTEFPSLLLMRSSFRGVIRERSCDGVWLVSRLWKQSQADLRIAALLLNSGLDLTWTDSMHGNPLHGHRLHWHDKDIPLLGRIFRRFGTHNTTRILNTVPANTFSLLYGAAARNQCQLVMFFLKHGAQIDIEGGRYGTALMVAACYSRLEAVKTLVKAGAKVVYHDSKTGEVRSAYNMAAESPEIQRWLIVGRFAEVRCIAAGAADEEIV